MKSIVESRGDTETVPHWGYEKLNWLSVQSYCNWPAFISLVSLKQFYTPAIRNVTKAFNLGFSD